MSQTAAFALEPGPEEIREKGSSLRLTFSKKKGVYAIISKNTYKRQTET